MKKFIIRLIQIYRRYLSPFSGSQCRFCPTCSKYAEEALQKHGVLKGLVLTVYRILRCQPFCTGGIDPVPQSLSPSLKVKKEDNYAN